MAMDKNLQMATQKLMDAYMDGDDTPQYRAAWLHYLTEFKRVAIEIGEPVLLHENPYDDIMEMIFWETDKDIIQKALNEFGEMVEILEDIGYQWAHRWRNGYDECYNELNKMEA